MTVERAHDTRPRKESSQGSESQNRPEGPDGDFAGLMEEFFEGIGAELIRQRRNHEQPDAYANEDREREKFMPQNSRQHSHQGTNATQKFLRKSSPA